MNQDTMIFYSTPAFGHVSPSLEIVREYVNRGNKVYYYSTKQFEPFILKTGAIFKEYDFDPSRLDLTVGSKLIKLEDTIITFADELTEGLLEDARIISPRFIIHDNIAMWGRIIGKELDIPTISLNTFPIVPHMMSSAGRAYTKNFGGIILKDVNVVSSLHRKKWKFRKKYPGNKLNMLSLIQNPEELNLLSFPGVLQPGYSNMTEKYYSLGSSSLSLDKYFGGEIIESDKPVIYLSLGTIFQNNIAFYHQIIDAFAGSDYSLVISMSDKNQEAVLKDITIPSNIKISSFVSQGYILDKSCLFITAGGMNSLCQAISRSVPCLMYPQEGEQRITCEMVERIGLGKILKNSDNLLEEALNLIREYNPDKSYLEQFREPDYDKLFEVIDNYCKR